MRYLYISLLIIVSLPSIVKGQIISTIAGNGTAGYSGDGGQATDAELSGPSGLFFDVLGNLYIADYWNNRVRKISTTGIISTVAGNGTGGYSGDGTQATTAELNGVAGVTIDAASNLYIADWNNNCIRKVTLSTGIISTVAGTGTAGYTGDGGQATDAELWDPSGVTSDIAGNLYITDEANNVIRMVNTLGIISTIAGNGVGSGMGYGGYSGDGGLATAAELYDPDCLVFDTYGNMYIADADNMSIRIVSTTGIITTIAGGHGGGGYSGDGGQATNAELYYPTGVCLDAIGNLYIADEWNNRIRLVNASGVISTIIGNGTAGYSGDGGQATVAELNFPAGVTFDAIGNLFIADYKNNRIRKVTNIGQTTGIEAFANINEQVTIYPNPNNGLFTISFGHAELVSASNQQTLNQVQGDDVTIEIYNMVGACVHRQIASSSNCQINVADLNEGVYNISIANNGAVVNKRVVIVR